MRQKRMHVGTYHSRRQVRLRLRRIHLGTQKGRAATMITDADRKQLNEWFRVDATGLSLKDGGRLETLRWAALAFAKAVLENVHDESADGPIVADILSAYRKSVSAVKTGFGVGA